MKNEIDENIGTPTPSKTLIAVQQNRKQMNSSLMLRRFFTLNATSSSSSSCSASLKPPSKRKQLVFLGSPQVSLQTFVCLFSTFLYLANVVWLSCRFLQPCLMIFSMPPLLQTRCLRYSMKFMGFSLYFSFHFY